MYETFQEKINAQTAQQQKLTAYYMRLSKEIEPSIDIYSAKLPRDVANSASRLDMIGLLNVNEVMICNRDFRAIAFADSKNDREEVFEVWKRTYLELVRRITIKLST